MNKLSYSSLKLLYPSIASEWHSNRNGNIKASDVKPKSNKKVWWTCRFGHEWEAKINNRTSNLSGCPFCSGRKVIIGKTDLATLRPDLATEWHPTHNGKQRPTDICLSSDKKVWWVCPKGHTYEASVDMRTRGKGCPYCSNKLPIIGVNDLTTVNPALAAQWHPTRNFNLKPTDVTAFSNKKVWWICKKKHEWEATVNNRSRCTGCPFCSGRLPISGVNDLETINPVLAAQWHPTKNLDMKPSDVTAFSNKKVWWICKKKHEWETTVANRSNGKGCPFCSNKLPIIGVTDLASLNPLLARQWHPTRNFDLKPSDVTAFSKNKVWWICKKKHEWEATVTSRSHGNGCPFCSGRLPISGVNDLETINPVLAAQWHPTKNLDKKPSNVSAFSNKKAWWICKKKHEWEATVVNRSNGTRCPFCTGRLPILGVTDLVSKNPILSAQWHPTKNIDMKPSDVTAFSNKIAWWICDKKHEWEATVASRSNGSGCPHCLRRQKSKRSLL